LDDSPNRFFKRAVPQRPQSSPFSHFLIGNDANLPTVTDPPTLTTQHHGLDAELPPSESSPPSASSFTLQKPSTAAPGPTVEFPNNEKTFHQFRFYNNGNKTIKDVGKRTYYKCTNTLCNAKYTCIRAFSIGDRSADTLHFSDAHNHPPPSNPSISPEVKERSLSYLRVGASPANIHKSLVQAAPLPLSSADVPTPGMLRKWKHRDWYSDMESSKSNHLPSHFSFHSDFSTQMMPLSTLWPATAHSCAR
jgi:hypothetical protein